MNPKAEIQAQWLTAKEEREKLEKIVNDGEMLPQAKYKKLFVEALEKEKKFYFQLTGKSCPSEKKTAK